MIWRLLLLFLWIALAVLLAILIQKDPGLVMINIHGYSIEMGFWVAALSILILFILFYSIVRIYANTRSLPKRLQKNKRIKALEQSINKTEHGFFLLSEGRYQEAEQYFSKSLKKDPHPILHYFGAAQAAQAMGEKDRRDNYLNYVLSHAHDGQLSQNLLNIQQQIHENNWVLVERSFAELDKKQQKHPYAQRLQAQYYCKNHKWEKLLTLLPQLNHQSGFSQEKIHHLTQTTHCKLITQYAKENKNNKLTELWQKISKKQKKDTVVIVTYCHALLGLDKNQEAIQLIQRTVKKTPTEDLIDLFYQCHVPESETQRTTVRSWLKQYPDNAAVHRCLGQLYLKEKNYTEAELAFESALKLEPSTRHYRLLGDVLEKQGYIEKALSYFRKAAQIEANIYPETFLLNEPSKKSNHP